MSCQIILSYEPAVRILRLVGDNFGMEQTGPLRNLLKQTLAERADLPLAIVTQEVELVGSCCLSGIIEAAVLFRKRRLPVFLVEARTPVLEIFETTSIDAVIRIYATLEDGLAAIANQAAQGDSSYFGGETTSFPAIQCDPANPPSQPPPASPRPFPPPPTPPVS